MSDKESVADTPFLIHNGAHVSVVRGVYRESLFAGGTHVDSQMETRTSRFAEGSRYALGRSIGHSRPRTGAGDIAVNAKGTTSAQTAAAVRRIYLVWEVAWITGMRAYSVNRECKFLHPPCQPPAGTRAPDKVLAFCRTV